MLPERRRLEAASKSTVTAAEYVRFKWGLDLLRRTVDDAFTDVDVVVAPTVRILPPLLNDMIKAAREGNASITTDIIANTQPFNVYGIPAVTVPCGFSTSGLPIRRTRIPVELIIRRRREGASEDDVLDAYARLTRENIQAAMRYAEGG